MRWWVTVAVCVAVGVGLAGGCAAREPGRATGDSAAEIVPTTPVPATPVPATPVSAAADEHGRDQATGSRVAVRLDRRCKTGRVLCADKSTDTLRWVVDGEVMMTFDARFGARSSPTREGAFDVYAKDRNHVSSLYGTPMPFTMFFSGGQAVHYSRNFATKGYAGRSHGCINLRDYRRAARLFDRVRVGDRVIVYRSASFVGDTARNRKQRW